MTDSIEKSTHSNYAIINASKDTKQNTYNRKNHQEYKDKQKKKKYDDKIL